jgi:hypothetical protein
MVTRTRKGTPSLAAILRAQESVQALAHMGMAAPPVRAEQARRHRRKSVGGIKRRRNCRSRRVLI